MILVTGAGGWLGLELVTQLLEMGEKVRAFDFRKNNKLDKLQDLYKQQLEIVIGDICNKDSIDNSLCGINTVYHLAGKVHVIPTNKDEVDNFFKINTYATQQLFELCLEHNVEKVIFFSSVSVYEESNFKMNVSSNKIPSTIYGKSKLEAEKIANELYLEKKLPVIIIEPATVYGEGDIGNFKKLENLINKGICVYFGNGKNKKTVIYYKDLIRMVIEISKNNDNLGKTKICATEVLSINDINDILIKKSKKNVIKLHIPLFLAKCIIFICSVCKLKKIKRKITALIQNTEFEIEKILSKYTSFKEYNLNGDDNG